MSFTEVEVDNAAVTAALRRLMESGRRLRPAFASIGEQLIVSTRKRFASKQAPDGTPWARNRPATIARKGRNDPLVGESRQLMKVFARPSDDALLVGSSRVYSAVQQFGAKAGAFGRTRRGAPVPWGDIAARPFLGLSSSDADAVLQVLAAHMQGRWGR